MIKVKYPENTFSFICDYLEIFDLVKLEQEWQQYKCKYTLQNADFSIINILCGDFDFLLIKSWLIAYGIKDVKHEELKKIFNYDTYQPKIADFFMKYKDEMKLSTCYYCNIDYINAFTAYSYRDMIEYINNANHNAFKKINNISEVTYEKIDKERPYFSIDEFEKKLQGKGVNSRIKDKIKTQTYPVYVEKNHFTLDHVIDKGTNPIVALSLFNFVPSCYSCNSKFKKSEQFTVSVCDAHKSPTSCSFNFENDVKLKALYAKGKNSLNINSIHDFEINFDDARSVFKDYIAIFKLEERYRFHKNIALEVLNKRQDYSDSQIKEISKILAKTEDEIKKDIFGKEIFEDKSPHEKPFTKLKRDIYE